jgi:hypothetical protein
MIGEGDETEAIHSLLDDRLAMLREKIDHDKHFTTT